jgi:hypothetical protein
MPLQEWIHKFEEGEGVRHIKLAFLILAFAGLAAWYDVRNFKNFSTLEAMDSAQIARQLAAGRGFSTKFIRPLSIRLLQNQAGDKPEVMKGNHPDLANAPVFPVIEAGLIKVLPMKFQIPDGPNFLRYGPEVWIAIFNQLLFLGLLWALHKLCVRLFDAAVANTTVAVTAFTELFWRFSVSGLPTIFLALITIGIVWCLAGMESRTRDQTATDKFFYIMSACAGLLLAIGALTRYSYGFLILPVVGFAAAFFGARRSIAISTIVVIFILALAPWCVRNWQLSGKPFGIAGFASYQGTYFFPHNRLERSMPKNLEFELNKVSLDQFRKKMLPGIGTTVRDELPHLGGSWVTALFLVGLLVPFRNPGLSRLRWFLLVTMALIIMLQNLGRTYASEISPDLNSETLLLWVVPLVFMFGIALFYTLLDQLPFEFPHYRSAAVGGFIVAVSLPLIFAFMPPKPWAVAWPPYFPPRVQEAAGMMREDEMMMSDMPWAVAWYGDRSCVWTTLDAGNTPAPNDFFTLNDSIKPVKGLLLTPMTTDARFVTEMLKGGETAWSRFVLDSMVRTNVPPGFPLRFSPHGYLPEFLFLTDRKRW